jgi:hypothetical protein
MNVAIRIIYSLLGATLLAVGAVVLLFKTGLLPPAVQAAILSEADQNLNTLHVAQELATLLVFAGLITFWFAWHYDQSRYFHWAMTALLGLLALVHWFDVRGPNTSLTEPIPITVPFLAFVAIGLWRLGAERNSPA